MTFDIRKHIKRLNELESVFIYSYQFNETYCKNMHLNNTPTKISLSNNEIKVESVDIWDNK